MISISISTHTYIFTCKRDRGRKSRCFEYFEFSPNRDDDFSSSRDASSMKPHGQQHGSIGQTSGDKSGPSSIV